MICRSNEGRLMGLGGMTLKLRRRCEVIGRGSTTSDSAFLLLRNGQTQTPNRSLRRRRQMCKRERRGGGSAPPRGPPLPELNNSSQTGQAGNFWILFLINISEPTRPLYISYAVFCLKKKKSPCPSPPHPAPSTPHLIIIRLHLATPT